MNPETEYREGLEELAAKYREVLTLIGEDPEREGLEEDTHASGESHAGAHTRL